MLSFLDEKDDQPYKIDITMTRPRSGHKNKVDTSPIRSKSSPNKLDLNLDLNKLKDNRNNDHEVNKIGDSSADVEDAHGKDMEGKSLKPSDGYDNKVMNGNIDNIKNVRNKEFEGGPYVHRHRLLIPALKSLENRSPKLVRKFVERLELSAIEALISNEGDLKNTAVCFIEPYDIRLWLGKERFIIKYYHDNLFGTKS
jgi:hypothetical protein